MEPLIDLSVEAVKARLHTTRYGRSIELVSRTGSTNDDARARAQSGAPDGHVIVADSQDTGRGSRGRTWLSPPGQDLYVSIVARVPVLPSQLPPLTLAVGLAVAETVDASLGAPRARVKWPNDVWIDDRKVAGVLLEGSSAGQNLESVIIGIGLNVNRDEFPDWLDTPGTSLRLGSQTPGVRFERSLVLARLLDDVERWVDRFVAHGVEPMVGALEQRLALRGERVHCDGLHGVVEGVSRSGALRLRTERGLQEVFSGRIERLP